MKKYFGSNRPRVVLKKGKAKPFWYRHPWIFSGAVQEVKGEPEDGDVVDVMDETHRFIGKGFYNSRSQIRVRLLSWDMHEKINDFFFRRKIHQAIFARDVVLGMRSKTSAYRLVHGEADGLPGLVVDRYNNVLSAQFLSLGMERNKESILEILREEANVKTIVERYSAGYRQREGLEEIEYRVHGPTPPEQLEITEYGLKFAIHLQKGQKTGFYLDQRENRMEVSRYGHKKKVLDAFCYSGGFGLYLLAKGKASHVVFMDNSPLALELVQENLKSNKQDEANATLCKADIFEKLPQMERGGEKFDIVILDPPKVSPDKASLEAGIKSLHNLNTTASRMINPGGILVTCDCSGSIDWEEFLKILNRCTIDAGRSFRIFHTLGAGPDHPINPACVENSYLKVVIGILE